METLESSLLWLLLGNKGPDITEDWKIRSHVMGSWTEATVAFYICVYRIFFSVEIAFQEQQAWGSLAEEKVSYFFSANCSWIYLWLDAGPKALASFTFGFDKEIELWKRVWYYISSQTQIQVIHTREIKKNNFSPIILHGHEDVVEKNLPGGSKIEKSRELKHFRHWIGLRNPSIL